VYRDKKEYGITEVLGASYRGGVKVGYNQSNHRERKLEEDKAKIRLSYIPETGGGDFEGKIQGISREKRKRWYCVPQFNFGQYLQKVEKICIGESLRPITTPKIDCPGYER